MAGWDPAPARRYHERTKHTYASVRAAAQPPDSRERPHPFKLYRELEELQLSSQGPSPDAPALDTLEVEQQSSEGELDLACLGWILRWGAGVVRSRSLPGGETYHFRTYSSAGALYPLELYVACPPLGDVEGGLYHFHPGELMLRRMRPIDARAWLADAADEPCLAQAGAVIVVTGIMSRSAWKYGARAYRHLFWDAGTMLANLLALATSARLGSRLLTAFADRDVNDLLGVDGEYEAALALLAIGRNGSAPRDGRLKSLELDVEPSSNGKRYPEALELRTASCLRGADEVRAWRATAASLARGQGGEAKGIAHEPEAYERAALTREAYDRPALSREAYDRAALSRDPVETVIRRRGSTREFAPTPVPVAELAAILVRAAGHIPADVPPLNDLYLAVHAVDGLEPGGYAYSPPHQFRPTRRGRLRRAAGFACLGQLLGATSAATVFLMVDLERVLEALGSRGYHAASLDAGVRAGRIYLGAYAQGLGATGLTFYDDEVTELVAPRTRLAPMMTVAIGVDARRPRLRRPGR